VTTPIVVQFQGVPIQACMVKHLFVDNCATHLQDKSFLWNIKFLHYTPNCTSAILSIRTEFGYMLTIQGAELECCQLQKSLEKPYLNEATNVTF
jgi:hypothetical protein